MIYSHRKNYQTTHVYTVQWALTIVKRQLEQFQTRQMHEFVERRSAALQYYREEYERLHPNEPTTCSGSDEIN